MATTTNFGWETPDDTDLVKDGAAAIRTALGGVDTSFVDLKGGTTGQVLAKASNTDLDFVWSADAAGMTNPMTTTGDTIYSSSGSTPARLGIGTSGQVLAVNGSGLPAWTTVASSSGSIKQVIFAEYSTATATNTTTYADLGLSATITPSSTSSQILIFAQIQCKADSAGNEIGAKSQLLRGATSLQTRASYGAAYFNLASNTAAKDTLGYTTFMDYDNPATTSATTYKIQGAAYSGSSVTWMPANQTATMILMEVLF